MKGVATKLNSETNYSPENSSVEDSFNELDELDTEKSAFPQELIEFSLKAEANKQKRSYSKDDSLDYSNSEYAYAAPLMPLSDRDSQALAAFFQSEDIDEIELNIQELLLIFYPTPCWEDDPLEFLEEYL